MSNQGTTLLRMEGITKAFPGVVANFDVNFELQAGEIHGLVGENGAGKSTLMKILYGMYRPDSGKVFVGGTVVDASGPRDGIRSGIGMVHQHFMLVPPFTVLENLVLGAETHRLSVLAMEDPRNRVEELMRANGLALDLDARVEDLPVGLQQRVEILKILYRGARILVFDEPTAVLTPQETRDFFRNLREMAGAGNGIIFISHKLDEVLEIADRITVMRRGRLVRTVDRSEASKPLVAELMVGKPVILNVPVPPRTPGRPVLEVEGLCMADTAGRRLLDGVSFSVREGEIFGIAGVEGNGQTELVRALAGRTDRTTGVIRLDGTDVLRLEVRERRERRCAHIPEDRWKTGLLLPFSVAVNLALGRHHRPPYTTAGWVRDDQVRAAARELILAFDIRTPDELTPVSALSGGNQQKLIVARELSARPRLLLASQPTRGVDVGATEFIYEELIRARNEGAAVLLVSADLDEVLALADRVGVMYRGRIVREFTRAEAAKKTIGLWMTGGSDETAAN